jgi:5-amino-6-(5-phosphoribosylamino)uracil reductase
VRDFEILFDHGERSELLDPVYSHYGRLGFPHPPAERPWTFANFVQSLDGIVSLLGQHASGGDISQSEEDRWLMDLLRAHADGVLMGVRTLILETVLERPRPRGPVFRIVEPTLQQLRAKLHRGPERNIFVTAMGNLNLADYAVFDGDKVEAIVLTSSEGAERLRAQKASHPHVRVIVCGDRLVDLGQAMHLMRTELGIRYLLCEGGPTLYGSMLREGLIDEKFLTVSPVEVGQEVPPQQLRLDHELLDNTEIRPTGFGGVGFLKADAPWWTWVSCRKVGDHQFNRYRLKRS